MRKVILYTAVSLDGFIAGPDNEIDWLFSDEDYGYQAFYETIDCLLWGHTTWKLVQGLKGFEIDTSRMNYIFTRNDLKSDYPKVQYVSKGIPEFVKDLKMKEGRDIWLVGGGYANSILLQAGLVDDMVLSYHPVVLGNGKPLFQPVPVQQDFKTRRVEKFASGLIQIWLRKESE
ncbi:MAG: dihydrofolate reductase family protein [Bacteroidales bacterium]